MKNEINELKFLTELIWNILIIYRLNFEISDFTTHDFTNNASNNKANKLINFNIAQKNDVNLILIFGR